MTEFLSLVQAVGIVAGKFLCVCGVIAIAWASAVVQSPGSLPF